MPGKSECLKYKQSINTSPAEAYRAFTSPTALTEWLCNQASVKSKVGNTLYLAWQNGYFMCGEYSELIPEKTVGFSWLGKGDPGLSHVLVTIKQKTEGVQVTLTHYDIGSGKIWKNTRAQIDKGWQISLENLKSVLENGQDLRLSRRPMMGIYGLEPVSDETANKLNLPKPHGLILYGVIDGMGAQNAGLQTDDVLVKMDGEKLRQEQDFFRVIEKHQAGDTIKVSYYQQSEKLTTELTFSERIHFDIPPKPDELSTQVETMYKPMMAQLESSLKGITDVQASFSGPGEWNVKQVLAHLIATEKDTHTWIAALIEDQGCGFEFHVNNTERLNAIISVCPNLSALIKDLKRNIAETVALMAILPESFVLHKRSYTRLGEYIFETTFHYQDHIKQIQKNIQNSLLQ
jgi:uncharacterized protein YndB with AHSA1/START domain